MSTQSPIIVIRAEHFNVIVVVNVVKIADAKRTRFMLFCLILKLNGNC